MLETCLASSLPQALPDMGSRNGSQSRSSTALRLMRKPWLAERAGSPCQQCLFERLWQRQEHTTYSYTDQHHSPLS